MTRKAGYPLGRAPWARGGAGGDVVDTRSALHLASYGVACSLPRLSSTYAPLKTALDGGGGRAERGGWGGGGRAKVGWGGSHSK